MSKRLKVEARAKETLVEELVKILRKPENALYMGFLLALHDHKVYRQKYPLTKSECRELLINAEALDRVLDELSSLNLIRVRNSHVELTELGELVAFRLRGIK